MNPSPQAISAAERMVRQQTGVASWRFQSGRWSMTVIDPVSGVPRSAPATLAQTAQFNAILHYYEGIYPRRVTVPQRSAAAPGAGANRGMGASGGVGGMTAAGAGSALARGFAGAAGAVTTPLVLGFGVLTVAVGALAGAIRIATTEATTWARSMSSLRANQGLSSAKSFGLVSRNSLFGITPQQTAQMYSGMSPMVAGMRGAATGFGNPYSANYLETAAARYQSMSPMLRNRLLDASQGGKASDELRQTLNLRPDQIRSQLAYGQNVQSQMGISPAILRRYSEEIPLAAQRVGFAVNMAKIKLAVELAPAIENGIGTVATLLAQNAGNIANAIKTGTRYLVYDLPPLLLRAGAGIARGGAFLLTGLGAVARGIAGNAQPILGQFDIILRAIGTFGETLSTLATSVMQVVRNVYEFAQGLGVPQALSGLGRMATGRDNDTPESRLSNGIIGGQIANFALPVGASLVGAAIQRRMVTRAVVNAVGNGAANGGGAAQPSLLARGWNAIKTGYQFLRSTPVGALSGVTSGGLLGALRAPTVLAGTALGVLGYEGLRRTNAFGYGSMPSTAQIIGTYTGLTDSPTEQARQSYMAQQAARDGRAVPRSNNPFINSMMGSNVARNPQAVGAFSGAFNNLGATANNGSSSLLSLADRMEGMANNWERDRNEDEKNLLRQIVQNTGSMNNKMQPANNARAERAAYDLVAAVSFLQAQQGNNMQLRIP